ncbi:hypothetical protein GUJ93_ZPchr0009g2337 [Zizania palustris]|uniref:Uncharacterized protein n=1 Tax=Zizania palustris TaxID=103762 RepID=A0A8J5UZE7_ZIZPA|nr:hypothetical protein GUJ93_ZPchr0009g2337 [Zizania palustris]
MHAVFGFLLQHHQHHALAPPLGCTTSIISQHRRSPGANQSLNASEADCARDAESEEPSSEEDPAKKEENKKMDFIGFCFMADNIHSSDELDTCESDDAECESCLVVMSELAQLRSTHAQIVENVEITQKQLLEVESSHVVINECMNYSLLVENINLRDKHVDELKARLESDECSKDMLPACTTCITIKDQLNFAREHVE